MNELTLTAEREERWKKINKEHNKLCAIGKTAMTLAIEIGAMLNEEQSKCTHGEWLPLLKSKANFSQRTAYNYMYLDEHKLEVANVATLTDALALLADSKALENGEQPSNSETLAAEAKRTGMSPRTVARARRVRAKAEPEVAQAMASGAISIATAEAIVGNNNRATQLANLAQAPRAKEKPKPSVPPPAPPLPENIKTAPPAKPEEKVPAHLLRSIITDDQYAKGFAVFSNVEGKPCSLTPDVCQLEHEERSPYMIGGSNTEKHRKAYAKWEQYDTQKIRRKVLKALEQMSPLDVPPSHKAKGFTYMYNLNKSQDLRELATMLSADLLRQADVLEQQEIYGHLFLT
jgi:Protein of unknown function (DUF3102)